ncbi:MAG: hypothetical protein IMZ53_00395 [Thermoplasmata archaeon]|nr:hypothetical protein [Thermoplasmata archaeon]
MKNLKELQRRRDLEKVWVTTVKWSDNSWGAFPEMGAGSKRENAQENARRYIYTNKIIWAQGTKTIYGFSDRIRFKKYVLAK